MFQQDHTSLNAVHQTSEPLVHNTNLAAQNKTTTNTEMLEELQSTRRLCPLLVAVPQSCSLLE